MDDNQDMRKQYTIWKFIPIRKGQEVRFVALETQTRESLHKHYYQKIVGHVTAESKEAAIEQWEKEDQNKT